MILLDIDGVIANPYHELNFQLQRDGFDGLVHPDQWTNYDWNLIYPHIGEEKIKEYFDNPILIRNAVPYEDAWYWINHMSSSHEIICITARDKSVESATYHWFYDWDIPVDKIYFEKHKMAVIEELGDHVCFVEDHGPTAKLAADMGFNSYLRSRSYNMGYSESPAIRINSLWEVTDGETI